MLIIMLPLEFYVLNSTTWLLWLFENCPHEALLGLIGLGAFCVVLCICVIVVRLVNESVDLSIVLFNICIRIAVRILFSPYSSGRSSYLRRAAGGSLEDILTRDNNAATRGDALLVQSGSPRVLPSLSLQWESVRTNDLSPSRLAPQALDAQALSTAPHVSRASLRRSRRISRSRATDSV